MFYVCRPSFVEMSGIFDEYHAVCEVKYCENEHAWLY